MTLLDWGGPDVVESFAGALDRRTWAAEAACAVPGQNELTWVVDIHNGSETTGSVVARFEVCARCPVVEPCLLEAMTERRWSVMGVWGGTVMTERTAAIEQARAAMPGSSPLTQRLAAAEMLAQTFAARTEAWKKRRTKRMALIHTEPPLYCPDCGQGLLFERTQGAKCSKACIRISRSKNRMEVAA